MDGAEKTEEEMESIYGSMRNKYDEIRMEVKRVVLGQDDVIEQILVSVFTNNHTLIEGYPGLGKTLIVKTLAGVMNLEFRRIQCTPDLMPSDVTGTYVIEEDRAGRKIFRFEKGPVFTNILLADEINRATPKAQSALLEAMQERQVTVGTTTYKLDEPFFVIATQNPIEMEGTYPLPEAQVDRFLMKILIDYPRFEDEEKVVELYGSETAPDVEKILNKEQLAVIQNLTKKMPIADDIRDYALNIVVTTRPYNNNIASQYLDYGASPRASIGLVLAAKARALIKGRNYVSREDIKAVAYPVLRHRLILNFESERKGVTTDKVIEEIIKGV